MIIEYAIRENGRLVGQEALKLFVMDYDDAQKMFLAAGFEPVTISEDGSYHIYSKKR